MPMHFLYTCAHCGANSEPVDMLPATWFSMNVVPTLEAQQTAPTTEYFDTWACVAAYATERAE